MSSRQPGLHNEILSQKALDLVHRTTQSPGPWFKRWQFTQSQSFPTPGHHRPLLLHYHPPPFKTLTSWAGDAPEDQVPNLHSHLEGQ